MARSIRRATLGAVDARLGQFAFHAMVTFAPRQTTTHPMDAGESYFKGDGGSVRAASYFWGGSRIGAAVVTMTLITGSPATSRTSR